MFMPVRDEGERRGGREANARGLSVIFSYPSKLRASQPQMDVVSQVAAFGTDFQELID
jgi:hypothetical protein